MEGKSPSTVRLAVLQAAITLSLALVCSAGLAAAQDPAVVDPQPSTRASDSAAADLWVESKIWSSFALHTDLNPFAISVDVAGDVAVLTGEVDEPADRELASRLAMELDEISRVDNRIEVLPASSGELRARRDVGDVLADSAITAAVKSRLLWNETTDGLAIRVDTAQGRVRLTGEADDAAAIQTAERLALDTDGVVGVDNQLTIIADPSQRTTAVSRTAAVIDDTWISTKVKSSLMYSRNVDGLDLDVSTVDGRVRLAGTVADAAERDLAVAIARDIRGVREVDATAVVVAQ
jgi:hyperosmotically inducible protein